MTSDSTHRYAPGEQYSMKLYLRCRIGGVGYLLDTARIACVLPLAPIRPVPSMSRGYRGIFEFRGRPVPVIDLSDLMTCSPAPRRLSTRLVLGSVGPAAAQPHGSGETHLLGVIAERATSLLHCDPGAFCHTAVLAGAAWLGPVIHAEGQVWQRIEWLALPGLCADTPGTTTPTTEERVLDRESAA